MKLTIALLVALFVSSCSEEFFWKDEGPAPVVLTGCVRNVTMTGAEARGTASQDGQIGITERGICWSTHPSPTVSDSSASDGARQGGYAILITGLQPNTLYHVRAYIRTEQGALRYGEERLFKTWSGFMSDGEGHVYPTVTIGGREWMAENLRATRYRNGSRIPLLADSVGWAAAVTPAYCWYGNDSVRAAAFGPLYNGHAIAAPEGLAPAGWHIPDEQEWIALRAEAGRDGNPGLHLRKSCEGYWETVWYPSIRTDDSTGFGALPGGYREDRGRFDAQTHYGYWWSFTALDSRPGFFRLYYNDGDAITSFFTGRGFGCSVRCVKD